MNSCRNANIGGTRVCSHLCTHTHSICSQQLSPVGLLTLHSRAGFDLFLGKKKNPPFIHFHVNNNKKGSGTPFLIQLSIFKFTKYYYNKQKMYI